MKNYEEAAVDAIGKAIAAAFFSHIQYDYQGFIEACNADGTYRVRINQQPYQVKNGTGINFEPGSKCLIHCISGNFNEKIIIAKL